MGAALQSILKIKSYYETKKSYTKEIPSSLNKNYNSTESQCLQSGFGGTSYGSLSSDDDYPFPCAICLDDCCGDQLVVSSSHCPHIFHKDCVMEWLEMNETCPCCRIPMITKEEIIKV